MPIAEINLVYSGWQVLPPVFAVFLIGFVAGFAVGRKHPADGDE